MRRARDKLSRACRRASGAGGHRAFTLIELLIVLAVIAILMVIITPSLQGAREQTNALRCQVNLRQIGQGIRHYLGDQGATQTFLNLYPRNPRIADRWNAMVLLEPYLGPSTWGGLYTCPSARGPNSVLDPGVRVDMERRAGKFHVYDVNGDGKEEFTEYWFNDSPAATYSQLFGHRSRNPSKPLGVSGQDLLRLENREAIVWAADAVDWIPRHQGRTMLLWGNESITVEALRPPEYLLYESRDLWGAPGPFYNWGHFYPDRYGP